jgi:hypothetical protein
MPVVLQVDVLFGQRLQSGLQLVGDAALGSSGGFKKRRLAFGGFRLAAKVGDCG